MSQAVIPEYAQPARRLDRLHRLDLRPAGRRHLRRTALLRRQSRPVIGLAQAPWPRNSRPDGIRVNSVAPKLHRHRHRTLGLMTEEIKLAELIDNVPLGRAGECLEDVAGVITSSSPPTSAAYVTGTTIEVNGGSYMR